MADNIALNSGSGGPSLASNEIASVQHQRVKLQHGAAGSATDVSTASPLPVTLENAVLTAAIHAITATINSSAMSDGLTALTPKFAIINASAGENNTVVAAVTAKKIRVLAVLLVGETGSGTVRFEDGAGGTALTGVMPLGDNSSITATNTNVIPLPFNPAGWFETGVNTLLNLESLTVEAKGCLTYVEVA